MSVVNSNKHPSFKVDNVNDHTDILKITRALASEDRLRILKYLLNRSVNIMSIANDLDMPISSVSRHIDILSDAGLIIITYQPGLKGHAKYCAQAILDVNISLAASKQNNKSNSFIMEMPIGMFSEIDANAPCGMIGAKSSLGDFDDPQIFYSPLRSEAECLWFESGSISYSFPSPVKDKNIRKRISFSLELCSDTIYFNNKWPSDITIKINDIEIITYTSPGNFGGKRGKFTPEYWPITSSQFGQLKKFSVDREGVYIDNVFQHNQVTFDDLHLFDGNSIKFQIGVKRDAEHRGGLTLFGKNFGDFEQAIIMKIS